MTTPTTPQAAALGLKKTACDLIVGDQALAYRALATALAWEGCSHDPLQDDSPWWATPTGQQVQGQLDPDQFEVVEELVREMLAQQRLTRWADANLANLELAGDTGSIKGAERLRGLCHWAMPSHVEVEA